MDSLLPESTYSDTARYIAREEIAKALCQARDQGRASGWSQDNLVSLVKGRVRAGAPVHTLVPA